MIFCISLWHKKLKIPYVSHWKKQCLASFWSWFSGLHSKPDCRLIPAPEGLEPLSFPTSSCRYSWRRAAGRRRCPRRTRQAREERRPDESARRNVQVIVPTRRRHNSQPPPPKWQKSRPHDFAFITVVITVYHSWLYGHLVSFKCKSGRRAAHVATVGSPALMTHSGIGGENRRARLPSLRENNRFDLCLFSRKPHTQQNNTDKKKKPWDFPPFWVNKSILGCVRFLRVAPFLCCTLCSGRSKVNRSPRRNDEAESQTRLQRRKTERPRMTGSEQQHGGAAAGHDVRPNQRLPIITTLRIFSRDQDNRPRQVNPGLSNLRALNAASDQSCPHWDGESALTWTSGFFTGMRRRKKENRCSRHIIQRTNRCDANSTCEFHDMDVPHKPCVCEDDGLSGGTKRSWKQEAQFRSGSESTPELKLMQPDEKKQNISELA